MLSSAVSASDIEETQVNVENDVDESVIVLSDVIMTDEGTYSDLADEIGQGGNIILKKSVYTYDNGSTININTRGVIDGNGALIDMANSSIEVFNIFSDDVVIKNLKIININSDNTCMAMHFLSSGTVQNCSFFNCSAYRGSAIDIGGTGLVENCNFVNNSFHGDTVYLYEGTVRNCNFTGNTGYDGAAVDLGHGTVEKCNFDSNRAEHDGGAVWIYDGKVKNCNFNNNYAGFNGGAVFMNEGSIDNCNFTNNKARENGGAVYSVMGDFISNSNFEKNDALSAGAVWISKGDVNYCNFKDNTAGEYAGAVYMWVGVVVCSNFNGDNAGLRGDAIFFDDYCSVSSCHFSNIDRERAVESDHYGDIDSCTYD